MISYSDDIVLSKSLEHLADEINGFKKQLKTVDTYSQYNQCMEKLAGNGELSPYAVASMEQVRTLASFMLSSDEDIVKTSSLEHYLETKEISSLESAIQFMNFTRKSINKLIEIVKTLISKIIKVSLSLLTWTLNSVAAKANKIKNIPDTIVHLILEERQDMISQHVLDEQGKYINVIQKHDDVYDTFMKLTDQLSVVATMHEAPDFYIFYNRPERSYPISDDTRLDVSISNNVLEMAIVGIYDGKRKKINMDKQEFMNALIACQRFSSKSRGIITMFKLMNATSSANGDVDNQVILNRMKHYQYVIRYYQCLYSIVRDIIATADYIIKTA